MLTVHVNGRLFRAWLTFWAVISTAFIRACMATLDLGYAIGGCVGKKITVLVPLALGMSIVIPYVTY